ncbi:hypothetical protein AMIS_56330 [Actinoplanes missouriensis 431]|uniref:DUF6879 domain-containing protein n=1 Tax=Actinoplanes missouriensis (strain ATCC 14538 / DSM 43046 / CBS 188.64 / JCM 3121 / NBRC 102363 / NCIMB 12654 / NRRL B-3342 / UNCC 431) TaxID=512565 RepID=I0HCW6_ACTM4|nr:DUF6879 family protein [Actinoplanes missouriensis]BAL90853.1 hypothetical protein AMIS_56330 [Actinoplanes missouriensis 431]
MQLLLNGAFEATFRSFERSAFHLEVADVYDIAEESEPIRRYLAGEPDDFAWQEPWLDLIRRTTATGRSVRRLRVVTVPHGLYTRWLLSVSHLNVDAGERIRWLPRDDLNGLPVTADDFWIFDDRRVVFTLVAPDGSFTAGAATEDPAIVGHCARVRDALWPRAVPHEDYVRP